MMKGLFGQPNPGGLKGLRAAAQGAVRIDTLLGIIVAVVICGLFGWMLLNPVSWQATPFVAFLRETNLMLLAPEAILMIVILAMVLHLAFSKTRQERQDTWWLATIGTVFTLACLLFHFVLLYNRGGEWLNRPVFYSMFNADLFSLIIRVLLSFGTLLVLMFSRKFVDDHADVPGEYYILLLSALMGGMLLSGSTDLIMLFVSLETLSISSYILVGYLRGNVLSAEAGLKYLVYGGMATACLLFGFSILYGLTGHTSFPMIAAGLASLNGVSPLIIAIMVVMILGGIGFKLSAAPFHMWAPDVYEGGPTPVIAFLSVVSKIAAFSLAMRFFSVLFGPMQGWFGLLAVLSVLSMVIGNVVALTQRNIKRLLAYSTVAHVGYLLLGLAIMTPAALASLLYYLATYLFMNLGAFAVVTYFENQTGSQAIADYAGLVRKRPALALIFTVMLLSLAGIPITAGFFGKFFLFQAVANAGSRYLWLVVIALLTSTVSLYYYLNVVRLMVVAEPSPAVEALTDESAEAKAGWGLSAVTVVMLLCLYGTLGLGLFAQPVMALSRAAVSQLQSPAMYSTETTEKPVLVQAKPLH